MDDFFAEGEGEGDFEAPNESYTRTKSATGLSFKMTNTMDMDLSQLSRDHPFISPQTSNEGSPNAGEIGTLGAAPPAIPACSQIMEICNPPNSHVPPHTHPITIKHIILEGTITIRFPAPYKPTPAVDDFEPMEFETVTKTYGPGDIIEIPAGKVHEMWIGPQGSKNIGLQNWNFMPPDVGMM